MCVLSAANASGWTNGSVSYHPPSHPDMMTNVDTDKHQSTVRSVPKHVFRMMIGLLISTMAIMGKRRVLVTQPAALRKKLSPCYISMPENCWRRAFERISEEFFISGLLPYLFIFPLSSPAWVRRENRSSVSQACRMRQLRAFPIFVPFGTGYNIKDMHNMQFTT